MRRLSIFICIIVLILLFCIRFLISGNFETKINNRNSEIENKVIQFDKKSILLYRRELYYSNFNTSHDFSELIDAKKLPIQYEMANFDIDLMPILFSDKIMLCQTNSLKILFENQVYEYICKEQIKCITYPEENDSILSFYIIKFLSDKIPEKVPVPERRWLLQKICFIDKKFEEETVTQIEVPKGYLIKSIKSEISFFNFYNNTLSIVLTGPMNDSAIFQFNEKGELLKKSVGGYIIIPNKFEKNALWYIKKDKENKSFLMKNEKELCEINNYISQGFFIKESQVELFFYDSSEFGTFSLFGGSNGPVYLSEIYFFDKHKAEETYFKEEVKKISIFNDKIFRDNILVVF